MQEPLFADMSPEDLLTWIENASKVLDQKVAAEKADIEERQQRLVRLLARRKGKDVKAKAKVSAKAKAKPAAEKPAAEKPRGRPPQAAASAPKPPMPKAQELKIQEPKAQDPAVAAE